MALYLVLHRRDAPDILTRKAKTHIVTRLESCGYTKAH